MLFNDQYICYNSNMKRFLVQVDGHPAAPVSSNVPSDADDLTNCPEEQLLLSAGREFTKRIRYPQQQWFESYPWLIMSKTRKIVLCSWCCAAKKYQ